MTTKKTLLEVVEHLKHIDGFLQTTNVEDAQKLVANHQSQRILGFDQSKFNRKIKKEICKMMNETDYHVRTEHKHDPRNIMFHKERLRKKLEERKKGQN